MAEVFELSGKKIDEPLTNNEAMAKLFEDMAAEARAGTIDTFITIIVRSKRKYSTRYWEDDTFRLIGACEAAKAELLADWRDTEETDVKG